MGVYYNNTNTAFLVLYLTDHESYIGCFYDLYDPVRRKTRRKSGGAVRVLPNAFISIHSNMTIGKCIRYCVTISRDMNMRYAGLEYSHECFCGAEDAQYDQYGQRDNDECSSPCSGNSNQACGGTNRIAVYDRKSCRS